MDFLKSFQVEGFMPHYIRFFRRGFDPKMDDIINIKIPVFEGPFDLLLHLIRENKIDIYDIPIALITGQYLRYIEMMKELNLEIAGEFLVMAATLIHIKSRMLLPPDEEAPSEEQEDPRRDLVERLLEYQKFKEAAGRPQAEGKRVDESISQRSSGRRRRRGRTVSF